MTIPQKQPVQDQPSAEQIEGGFRHTLEDVVDFVRALSPYCSNFDEMLEMAELGIKNVAQLRLLLSEVTRPKEEE